MHLAKSLLERGSFAGAKTLCDSLNIDYQFFFDTPTGKSYRFPLHLTGALRLLFSGEMPIMHNKISPQA